MPEGAECYEECEEATNDECYCEEIGIFDLEGQIKDIFENSRIGDIANVGALKDWDFASDFSFYTVVGLTVWFGGSVAAFSASSAL
eukprot:CAMPEP_0114576376 /NCGR_PEP_ID=MMETSP0125-20121206/1151_1 /TAXON_ID=485358 ORGANISM="Aristerostoma sp., Strain ATCC 50986" /NCGR_SAMPLE_ID=MMETSP0125 /ASSEMBLY_ACC=CAM_ASM_000245 /LENGTH=85 /DNA_ID=CAMNT_0001764855 /DNA_START=2125 /DNA_END=2382 /DNA_ORIENTATION=-